MFSGIVEELGVVDNVIRKRNLSVLKVRSKKIFRGAKKGDSVSIDGVCLTVTQKRKNVLTFDVMRETLVKTTLGQVQPKTRVNLERALKVSDRISGHFVTGHIDCVAGIKEKITKKNYVELRIGIVKKIRKYIAPKGSVSLDGVSMTIGDVRKDNFSVYLIPLTLDITTLGIKGKKDKLNIEVDILARYILNK